MSDKILVKFLRQHLEYNSGELAGFPAHGKHSIDQWVEAGIAEIVSPKPATTEAPAKAVVTDTSRASAKKAATKRKTKKG